MKIILSKIIDFYKKNYLGIVISLFLVACAINIGAAPFWRDEAFSALVATKSISEVIATAVRDTQPPLHMLLLHLSYLIGGKSEILARLWSVVGAVLTIIFTTKITNKIFKEQKLGYFVAPLIAFNPVLLYYGFEARSYALFTAMFVIGIYLTISYTENPTRKKAILLMLVSIIGLYLHNLFVVCFGVIMLNMIIARINQYRGQPFKAFLISCKDIFLIGVVVILLYTPWLLTLLTQYQQISTNGFWLTFDYQKDFFMVLGQSFFGESYYPSSISILCIIAVSNTLLSALGVIIGWKDDLKGIKKRIPILSLASLLPMLILYVVSFKTPFMYVRYLIFTIPFFIILLVNAYKKHDWLIKIVLILTIVFTSVTAIINPVKKEDYVSLISALDYQAETDVVLHNSALPVFGFRYYSNIPSYIYASPDEIAYYQGKAALTAGDYWQDQDLTNVKRIWLVEIAVDNEFYKKIENLGFSKISTQAFNGNLNLVLFERL